MRIDAHQHFWDYATNAADYVWMGEAEAALRRDYLPADLEPLLAASGYDGTVVVQAREIEAETRWLTALADATPFVHGVVGWADLCAPDAAARIDALAHPKLKGFRMLIHDRPDPDFAASPDHLRGVALLEPRGLTYDLLLKPPHIAAAIRLVDALPYTRFVVDHIAKPALDESDWGPWSNGMRELAARANVWCKLSGLATLGNSAALPPRIDHVLDAFGAARCMIGSDWPVATLGADYVATMALVEDWAVKLSADEQAAILGGSATAFYGLEGK
ncbi:amidohydrolase family protein [Sandaracinobacteroides saxicola]|uniref:Amidohydrolase family protein n=1 Tax=Sandaracinobacteroides saxicola TaxID=2759707 RepID=A0A7G5IM49_9SPHN|nr:amidohydrolase family protein [Sandaracinobacteroides saxicola]QMW24441.1 amidohydrolase family protein [Sandaracinobacteroides saxicola]